MRYRLRTLIVLLVLGPPLLGALVPVIAPYFREADAPEPETSDETDMRVLIGTDLAYYAYRNDVPKLREELAKGADINETTDFHGWTALFWAIEGNSHEAVEELLKHDPARLADWLGFFPSSYAQDDRMRDLLKIPAADEQAPEVDYAKE